MKGVKDAFSRLSGAKETTVNLQEGLIVATTDPAVPVLPSLFWKEVQRVGFLPQKMEIWATGSFDSHRKRWDLITPDHPARGVRRARFKVSNGAEDPPHVELIE